MKTHVGIDIGSRTIKLVLLQDGHPSGIFVRDTTFDPIGMCRELLFDVDCRSVTATGYGRRLFAAPECHECDHRHERTEGDASGKVSVTLHHSSDSPL